MVLVNNPGDWNAIYAPLRHADWHGWTCTDLIFPFFLWIAGVAIPFSLARRLQDGAHRKQLIWHALRRAAVLFGIGLFLNSFGYLIDGDLWARGVGQWLHTFAGNLRIPGVLQRIAICYLAAFLVALPRGHPVPGETAGGFHLGFAQIRNAFGAVVVLLASYWLLMKLCPVPGYGAGLLEKESNFSGYVDNLVFNGPSIGTHVWKTTRTWDPEGIVSTLPAIATCLFGVVTGLLLLGSADASRNTRLMLVAGTILIAAGQLMSPWLPINKNLWTSSFAVFTAGVATVCFAGCYAVVELMGWRKWSKPFVVYGMNAIAVFTLAGILGRLLVQIRIAPAHSQPMPLKDYLFERLCAPLASARNASLLWAVLCVLVLYLIAWAMYGRKWFVKV